MNKEEISALIDGELSHPQSDDALKSLAQDAAGLAQWHTYQLIGDTLRGTPPLFKNIGPAVARRLAAEATILAPYPRKKKSAWLALSAAASLAAVALIGWVALQTGNFDETLLASDQKLFRQAAQQQVANLSPAAVNSYLIAHQEFSPTTNMQGIGPYLRTVVEVDPGGIR